MSREFILKVQSCCAVGQDIEKSWEAGGLRLLKQPCRTIRLKMMHMHDFI